MRYVFCLLLITACGTWNTQSSPSYKQHLESLIGTDINSTIKRAGIPTKVMDLTNGERDYEWVTGNGSSYTRIGSSLDETPWKCTVDLFTDKEGIIRSYRYFGNTCH